MIKNYAAKNNSYYILKAEFPNECPLCHASITADVIYNHYNFDTKDFSFFCLCPNCQNTFLVIFKNNSWIRDGAYHYSENSIYSAVPKKFNAESFDENISKISSSFVSIYNQAKQAEALNLTDISGIGYRKAIEFLIKDYCIHKNPDKEEEIKQCLLGQVIDRYISDQRIKTFAKVSTWLGNDETHYVRKFEDKDIDDLKKFIKGTVYFISYDLAFDDAREIVSSK